jgi:hypothetical protein
MDKRAGRWLLAAFALLFGVFYGVSVTREGIGHIYGPLEAAGPADDAAGGHVRAEAPERTDAPKPALKRGQPGTSGGLAAGEPTDEYAFAADEWRRLPAEQTALSRIVGKTGDLLRILADGFIRLLVGLGEAVLS